MVIANNYRLKVLTENGEDVFYVVSRERHKCDLCGARSKQRELRRKRIQFLDGEKTIILRIVQCVNCKRLDTEYPNFMVPQRRYSRALIVSSVNDPKNGAGVDDSTLRRWRNELDTDFDKEFWEELERELFLNAEKDKGLYNS